VTRNGAERSESGAGRNPVAPTRRRVARLVDTRPGGEDKAYQRVRSAGLISLHP
jgi:hypothetical protein